MRLLYGTYNPAKLDVMREWLLPLGVTLTGLSDLDGPPGEVAETGADPLENARIKALGYRDATGMTTLAADSALCLEGVPQDCQPGGHVRRVEKRRMTDEEMIRHYGEVASSQGGRVKARYYNALCVAFADGSLAERYDESLASMAFYLVDKPHPCRRPGFPLDSLSVDPASGRYFMDLPPWQDSGLGAGIRRFVEEALFTYAADL